MPPSLRHGITIHSCGCLAKWPREAEPLNPASVYQLMAPGSGRIKHTVPLYLLSQHHPLLEWGWWGADFLW